MEKTATLADLIARIDAFDATMKTMAAKIEELEKSSKATNKSDQEMTDDHAKRVLIGDCKDMKHNDAAKHLGLSYGQIYSCRGEYTFRHIHKELKARPEGFKNPWKK
jgi:hypothetical protein